MKNCKPPTLKSLCLLLMLFISTWANATTYYFSSSEGDDSRTAAQAQNPATPWKSIAKLNAVFSSLSPGDIVLFKRGDVFTGTISVTASGSPSNPILLEAYGTGAKPVISGLSSLSGWVSVGGNIWEAALPSALERVSVLLLNDAVQRVGRYPNSDAVNGGYLTIESSSANYSITDNQLPAVPNWNGGEVVIRKNRWVLDRNKITNHSGNTIHYTSQSGYDAYARYGYFLQNHPKTLDRNGEWYYNSSNKKIGIYSSSSPSASVQASTVNMLVGVRNQNNIRFQNLIFKGSNSNALELDNAYGIQIINCDLLFSGADAVLASSCNNLQVEGCNILYSNSTALELRYSSNAIIRNNKIRFTGIFAGMGNGDSGSYEGILMDGDNELIEGNEIDSTGYIPITFRGNVNIIKNNVISSYNFVKDDGGGIYTWNNIAGAAPTYGSKITSNIVVNGWGAGEGTDDVDYKASNGIYMDDNTAGVEIIGNTVANCGLYGLYIHNGHELTVLNNTFFNSRSQAVLAHDAYAAYAPIRNVNMNGNIFFSKDNYQLLAEFKTPNNDIANFGIFDNNYYCRPGYDSYVINTAYQSDATNLDLAEWKALYGKDGASTKSPVSVASYNSVRFEYNTSATAKTVGLDGTYVDVKNTVYNGTITLTPYSSAVLMKQVPATAICPGTGSITREQWNGTANGGLDVVPWQTTPTKTTVVTGAFETANIGDAYGARIRGYICAPQTGNYIFWLAADDVAELWLSTDANPANKKKIANVESWTTFRDWNKTASQKSVSIHLEAGKKYYIEALQKEGNGGDHLSVAWQRPDGVFEGPIEGARLSPAAGSVSLLDQTINFPSLPNAIFGTGTITLSATASSGLPVSFSIVSGPATLNGNVLAPTGVGTVVIKASQPGNAQYKAAPDVTQNLIIAAGAAGQCASTGTILREQWNGINGSSVAQIPLTTQPTSTSQLTGLEGPKDIANQYASRIRGYICPPQTGNYTFWIAGDDATELWLSTDSNASNKIKIAYNLNWTLFREWDKYPSQKSASIYLQASSKYYIEALQKEEGGGDHLSVAWQLPDGTKETPIPGSRLSPFQPAVVLLNQTINFAPLQNFSLGSSPLELIAFASSGLPVSFTVVSGAATISGNIITPTAAGVVIIKALQAGNAQYNAAPDVVQELLVVAAPQPCAATGSILREQWNGINGNDVAQIPVTMQPSSSGQLTSFEGPQNIANQYGSRIRGYICPPQTGNYTFWIAGDDGTELWLSTNENPANKTKIAYSLSWTYYREWNRYASQKSAPVFLEGGKKYYIEALQKEGDGGDHLSVAWQLPGGVVEAPIAGSHLSPYIAAAFPQNQTISFSVPSNLLLGSAPVTLAATASSGLPVSFTLVSGPATLAGAVLTATGLGTIVIKASQNGNAQYNAAPDVVRNLTVVATGVCSATGTILREQWNGIDGNDVSQIPQSSSPSSSSQLTSFEGPKDIRDQYGSRIRGYICPPQTGTYTFWVAGDDGTELWLSTNESPASKIKIAYSLSWTYHREWNRYASQKSVAIYLQAGTKYYIEALQKEGAGGDHLSVSWQFPDGTMEAPISGSHLSPYVEGTNSANKETALAVQEEIVDNKTGSENVTILKAYPNPFSLQTTVELIPAFSGAVSVDVYDVSGRGISNLFNGIMQKGVSKQFQLQGRSLSAGIYFIRVASADGVINYKVIKR